MEKEAAMQFVRVLVKMVDSVRVEKGTAAFYAMHLVSLGKEQLGEIGAILTSDAGNQSFCHYFLWSRNRGHGMQKAYQLPTARGNLAPPRFTASGLV
jgi:hypothetical protein